MGIDLLHRSSAYQPDYIQFTERSLRIDIEGKEALQYIDPTYLKEKVAQFSEYHPLRAFDRVYYNLTGGEGFAFTLATLQGYGVKNLVQCEYHPDGRIPTPIQEEDINKNILILDDTQDTRRTTDLIRLRAPKATMFFLTRKMIPNQILLPNSAIVLDVDDEWILGGSGFGGRGMNGDIPGDGYPKDWGRGYEGLAVKITEN